jgi:hypothetical protein
MCEPVNHLAHPVKEAGKKAHLHMATGIITLGETQDLGLSFYWKVWLATLSNTLYTRRCRDRYMLCLATIHVCGRFV